MLYHIVPPLILPGMEKAFLAGVDAIYEGPVTLSRDGTVFSLPAHSDDIIETKDGL